MIGCSGLTDTDSAPAVRVSAATIGQSTGIHVSYSVENVLDVRTYFPSCGGSLAGGLERWSGGRWDDIGGWGCLAIYSMVPIALDPAETTEGEIGIWFREHGIYRVLLYYGTSVNETRQERTVSRPFSLP
jgi:hypothetical protein